MREVAFVLCRRKARRTRIGARELARATTTSPEQSANVHVRADASAHVREHSACGVARRILHRRCVVHKHESPRAEHALCLAEPPHRKPPEQLNRWFCLDIRMPPPCCTSDPIILVVCIRVIKTAATSGSVKNCPRLTNLFAPAIATTPSVREGARTNPIRGTAQGRWDLENQRFVMSPKLDCAIVLQNDQASHTRHTPARRTNIGAINTKRSRMFESWPQRPLNGFPGSYLSPPLTNACACGSYDASEFTPPNESPLRPQISNSN